MPRSRPRRALTKAELKGAALVCFRSAEELLADAELLDSFKRYPRAVFLACIGVEELGKAAVSLELYEANWTFSETNVREFWQFWRDHMSKAAHGDGFLSLNVEVLEEFAADLLPEGHTTWKEYEEWKREFYGRRADALLSLKEAALYVDFVDRGEVSGFRLPSKSFTAPEAKKVIQVLREKLEKFRPRIQQLGWLGVPAYPSDWEEQVY